MISVENIRKPFIYRVVKIPQFLLILLSITSVEYEEYALPTKITTITAESEIGTAPLQFV